MPLSTAHLESADRGTYEAGKTKACPERDSDSYKRFVAHARLAHVRSNDL